MSMLKSLIAQLADVKDELREANNKAKEAKKRHDEAEAELIEYLKENELEKASAAGFTASYGTETVATVNDWEAFYDYVKEHDAFYLLQKRVASAAYRELLQVEGEAPPGTEPMDKDKLSFTRSGR